VFYILSDLGLRELFLKNGLCMISIIVWKDISYMKVIICGFAIMNYSPIQSYWLNIYI